MLDEIVTWTAEDDAGRPLTELEYEQMFVYVTTGSLTEERLENIERGARERHTLLDWVVLERSE